MTTFFNSWRKKWFLKLHDSLSSPYCYKKEISTCRFQNYIFFGVFSSFSIWIMASAGTKLGIWDWVTKSLTKGLLPLFYIHDLLLLFPTKNLQLAEVARKMVLPLTGSRLLTLARRGCKGLVHRFPPFGGRCIIGEKTGPVDGGLFPSLELLWHAGSCNHVPPLQIFLFKKKNAPQISVYEA